MVERGRLAMPGRLAIVWFVAAMVLASCSIGGPGGDDGGSGRPVLSSAASTEVAADRVDDGSAESTDPTDGGGGGAGDRIGADLWQQADDAVFLPDQPSSTFASVLAPATADEPWLIVGDIFDAATATELPTVWQAADPGTPGWQATGLDLPAGATSGWIADVGRFGDLVIAVGGHGRDEDRRPAAWVDDGTGWSSIDVDGFDDDEAAWLSQVAVDPADDRIVVLGRRADGAVTPRPEIWVTDDGSGLDRVDGPPLTSQQSVQSVAAGPSGIVAVGDDRPADDSVATAWVLVDGSGWEAVALPTSAAARSVVDSVVWFEDRYVAVGGVASGGEWAPTSWTSVDGVEWSADGGTFAPDPSGFISSRGIRVTQVAVIGDRLLATDDAGDVQQVWESTDGARWSTVPGLRSVQPQGVGIGAVAEAGGVVVAATGEPSLLVGADGWERVVIDPEQAPSPASTPGINRLVSADGRFLAVGALWDGRGEATARAWVSPDGDTWEETGRVIGAGAGPMVAATEWNDELVAVGYEELGLPGVSRPPRGLQWAFDGSQWRLRNASTLEDDGSARTLFSEVAAFGGELVIAGMRFGPQSDGVEPILFEFDGERWAEIDTGFGGPGSQEIDTVCGTENGVAVAAGIDSDDGRTDVVLLARSADGIWEEASVPPAAASVVYRRITDCANDGDRFLVSGWAFGDGIDDLLLWSSADGREWSVVDDLPEVDETVDQWASGATAFDGGFLVVGQDDTSGLERVSLWLGSDVGWRQLHLPPETDGMVGLSVAELDGTVVVQGWSDGAVRIYRASLAALVERAEGSPP